MFRRVYNIVAHATFAACILIGMCVGSRAQVTTQFSADVQFCPTIGAIAVRYPTRWKCLTPGINGQVMVSAGVGNVPGWLTPSGTGNVNTSGSAVANQLPYFTNGTTLGYQTAGGSYLDFITGFSSTGFIRRTAANTYSISPIAGADLPAIPIADIPNIPIAQGGTGQTTAGAAADALTQLSTTGVVTRTGTGAYAAGTTSVVNGGTGQTTAGSAADALLGLSSVGSVYRTGTGTYGISADPQPISRGGTGQTSGGNASITAILGASISSGCAQSLSAPFSTCLLQTESGPTYALATLSQLLDFMGHIAGPTQGSVLFRNSTGWDTLAPGTSGQFLAANGGGANPTWQSPSAPPAGSRVLLNTLTASNVASVQDTTSFTSTYSEYEIIMENFKPSAASLCDIQAFQSGAFVTSGYSITMAASTAAGGATQSSTTTETKFYCSDSSDPVAVAGPGVNGTFRFSLPQTAGINMVRWNFAYGSSNAASNTVGSGYDGSTGIFTGFKFFFPSGNIATGTVKIYGFN